MNSLNKEASYGNLRQAVFSTESVKLWSMGKKRYLPWNLSSNLKLFFEFSNFEKLIERILSILYFFELLKVLGLSLES